MFVWSPVKEDKIDVAALKKKIQHAQVCFYFMFICVCASVCIVFFCLYLLYLRLCLCSVCALFDNATLKKKCDIFSGCYFMRVCKFETRASLCVFVVLKCLFLYMCSVYVCSHLQFMRCLHRSALVSMFLSTMN